jgi:ribosomal protein S18 acetylase RimI-like enzyme
MYSMFRIVSADTPALIEQAITLSQEYVTWMTASVREHYPELDLAPFISEHDYDDVRDKFPGEHIPPYGRLLVAMNAEESCGCIALGKLSDTVCEMRTLYVRPACRKMGIGKALAEYVLDEARQIGYTHMRLDTLAFMERALKLYYSMGFESTQPYRVIPDGLKPHIRFLEIDLRANASQ